MKKYIKGLLCACFRLPRRSLETYIKTENLITDISIITRSGPSEKQLKIYGLHALRHLLIKGYSFTEIMDGEFIKDIKRKGELSYIMRA
ncbi:hypothetical protein LCGC14_0405370 [marine sediment metagenome]|uniref:Uncharacterized protein n=1 Tax=marine sediment metagenome TaxID=412755 RepID=A0A0F9W4L2_9ZZZZ